MDTGQITLEEVHYSYFYVTPKNQVLYFTE